MFPETTICVWDQDCDSKISKTSMEMTAMEFLQNRTDNLSFQNLFMSTLFGRDDDELIS